jgi:hypothetical protein
VSEQQMATWGKFYKTFFPYSWAYYWLYLQTKLNLAGNAYQGQTL